MISLKNENGYIHWVFLNNDVKIYVVTELDSICTKFETPILSC